MGKKATLGSRLIFSPLRKKKAGETFKLRPRLIYVKKKEGCSKFQNLIVAPQSSEKEETNVMLLPLEDYRLRLSKTRALE